MMRSSLDMCLVVWGGTEHHWVTGLEGWEIQVVTLVEVGLRRLENITISATMQALLGVSIWIINIRIRL